jgi:hypothetical protein
VDAQHALAGIRAAASAGYWVRGLNQAQQQQQRRSRYGLLHLTEQLLATGDFLLGRVLGIAEADLFHDLCSSAINNVVERIYETCSELP